MQAIKKLPFKGASCALITPFSDDGRIDRECFSALLERQISGGTASVTVLGTTGESPTVSDREHHSLLELAVKCSGGRIPIIAGCGSNDTHHACYLAESARDAGCDAVLAITPYYNKANASGLIRHFEAIADAAGIPIILYNVPKRTGVSIPFEVYAELSKHPGIAAVKDASGDFETATRIISELNGALYLYSGCDELTLPLLSIGAEGVISVASNIFPREMSKLCNFFFDGRGEDAKKLHCRLFEIFRMLSCDVNPIPVKAAASLCGLCEPNFRLPLCEPDGTKKEYISKIISDYIKNYGDIF